MGVFTLVSLLVPVAAFTAREKDLDMGSKGVTSVSLSAMERGKRTASNDASRLLSPRPRSLVLLFGGQQLFRSGLSHFWLSLSPFCEHWALGSAATLGPAPLLCDADPLSMAPVVGARREDILFLMMQVAEMGSYLEEDLHAHHQLEEALEPTRAALEATETEVEAAHLATDEAEARRVGICFRQFLSLWLLS